ncbi:hypothetical protein PS15m_005160 [Mucor circinelloides]
MIFRKIACNHDEILEFGTMETRKDYEDDEATRRLIEGFIKLPECLKKTAIDNIKVVEFIYSGLQQSFLVRADHLTPYVTRPTKAHSHQQRRIQLQSYCKAATINKDENGGVIMI